MAHGDPSKFRIVSAHSMFIGAGSEGGDGKRRVVRVVDSIGGARLAVTPRCRSVELLLRVGVLFPGFKSLSCVKRQREVWHPRSRSQREGAHQTCHEENL
eukprot:6195664-Prymnesium_polylepis.1